MKATQDVIDRLPAVARARLQGIAEAAEETQAVIQNCAVRLMELGKDIRLLRQQRDNAANDTTATAVQKKSALDELDAALKGPSEDHARLSARKEIFDARRQRLNGLLSGIADWLNALPRNAQLSAHPGRERANKNEVTPDDIEKRRRRIRELVADIRSVDAAPITSAEAKQIARAQIEELAKQGEPDFFPLIEEYGGRIRWPQRFDNSGIGAPTASLDGGSLFACVMREQLIAFSDARIDEAADDGHALTDVQRADKFKTLFSDLLAAEREEEDLVQAAGFDVDRRADADPRAVLGLSGALPGPKRGLVHSRLIASVESLPRDEVKPLPTRDGAAGSADRTRGALAIKVAVPRPLELDVVTRMNLASRPTDAR